MSTQTAAGELTSLGAAEIARGIAAGQFSSREVTAACIHRIEETRDRLNAVVVCFFERALVQAAAADGARGRGESLGPLHGVPVTVKECFDVAGSPTTAGLTTLAGQDKGADAALVARLRKAGAVLLGKTNVPQLLLANECENPVYGRTSNPWNPARTCGGSSGGEAAAIAAGGSALGLGSDIGGSLRLPAHACGISSLKPTTGRLNMEGHFENLPGLQALRPVGGPMARRVEDLALAMQVLAVPGPGPAPAGAPPVPWADPARIRVADLRIGWYADNGILACSPAVRRAVEEAAAALEERGARVGPWTPPDPLRGWELYMRILLADMFHGARRLAAGSVLDRRVRGTLRAARSPRWFNRLNAGLLARLGQPEYARILRWAGPVTARELRAVLHAREAYRREFRAAFRRGGFNALLCPPDALPAAPHGYSSYLGDALSYGSLFNLLDMPAGVVAARRVAAGEESDRPAGRGITARKAVKAERGSAGLPVGVTVAAPMWQDDVVLAVMAALEQHFRAQPGYPLCPPAG